MQRVLAGWTGPELDFNAVFPRGRVQSPKVRAFVDFLVERLNFDADYMQVLCPNRQPGKSAQTRAAVALQLARAAARQAVDPASLPEPELTESA